MISKTAAVADPSPTLKAISLLETIAGLDHPPTLSELTEVASLPKPTLHRWLAMLETAEMLRRTPDGRRYELAPRAAQLGLAMVSNSPGAAQRRQILEKVVAELGESCNFTVLQGSEVTYLDRVEASQPLRVAFQKGSRVPAHCSASGKLFLAMMSKAKLERLLGGLALDRHTPNTLTTREALLAELAAIRQQGYALDDEEYLSGLFCIAVPVLSGEGRARGCLAGLALQAPVTRVSRANVLGKLDALNAAARAMSATLT